RVVESHRRRCDGGGECDGGRDRSGDAIVGVGEGHVVAGIELVEGGGAAVIPVGGGDGVPGAAGGDTVGGARPIERASADGVDGELEAVTDDRKMASGAGT